MKNTTQKIVLSAILAALTCIATMIIKIPSPLKGYVNLGDCIVLLSGWILNPLYGFFTAGLGSALADLFSGYIIYAPATFIIKGGMALIGYYVFKLPHKRVNNFIPRIVSGIIAELVMIMGYYIFEGFMYGFSAALINIPANIAQGMAGIVFGCMLFNVIDKIKN